MKNEIEHIKFKSSNQVILKLKGSNKLILKILKTGV